MVRVKNIKSVTGGSNKSTVIKSAITRLFSPLIILSLFFVSCEDEPELSKQQFAVWRGGEAVSIWVDVYRSGSVDVFYGEYDLGSPTLHFR